MRIFISFASEDRKVAEQIHLALLGAGLETFFDADSLPAGGDFNARIPAAIADSDLFIFLVSPDSVAEGSFARTELRLAREKWRHPAGRVLPVMVRRVEWSQLPTYVAAVTVLEPEGNVALEVARKTLDLATALRRTEARRRWLQIASAAAVIVIAASIAAKVGWWRRPVVVGGVQGAPTAAPARTETHPTATPIAAATNSERPLPAPDAPAREEANYPQCPELSRNPILARAVADRPRELDFTVDPARHILLDQQGRPPAVAAASSLGTLAARQILVVHFTASPAAGLGRFFERPDTTASAHALIDRKGEVQQFVPFDYAARHAGRGEWRGIGSLNAKSLGIELENWGRLERRDDRWSTWNGVAIPEEDVFEPSDTTGVGWQRYTCAQLRSFFHVAVALRRAYPTIEHMIGHEDIVGSRKTDPGPAFPMTRMRELVFSAAL